MSTLRPEDGPVAGFAWASSLAENSCSPKMRACLSTVSVIEAHKRELLVLPSECDFAKSSMGRAAIGFEGLGAWQASLHPNAEPLAVEVLKHVAVL